MISYVCFQKSYFSQVFKIIYNDINAYSNELFEIFQ